MLPDYGGGQHGQGGAGVPAAGEAFSSSNMAPFLTKLFQIVSAPTTDHCITWTAKGDSFVISDPDTFARDILPTYFKHNNIRSFIRQLNTYGFRKRTNISSTDEHLEFFHTKFRRDDPQGLTQIKRCHQPKPQASTSRSMPGAHEEVHGDPGRYNPDLDTIRSRVTELKTRLGSLQVREARSLSPVRLARPAAAARIRSLAGWALPRAPRLRPWQSSLRANPPP